MAEENEVESEEMDMDMDKSNMPSNEILIELFEALVGEESERVPLTLLKE